MNNEMPIGIFDSGVGGLTVMKEIIRALPDEHIIYLGDTARVPYGGRSSGTVQRYSVENTGVLVSRGIKLLVVACNTSSAVSLGLLRERFSVPVIGVVEPGARAAVETTRRKKVAVIGTETTINSGSYKTAIRAIDDSIEVFGVACPLFVPLIEEGWIDGEIVHLTARKYIASMNNDIDTVVLGCTHYPMIKHVISKIVNVPLIDSAVETAKDVRATLEGNSMLCSGKGPFMRKFLVTDSAEKFARVGERFLGYEISDIEKIELGG
jgi:glutamate racemase